jgi:hypothetical protein
LVRYFTAQQEQALLEALPPRFHPIVLVPEHRPSARRATTVEAKGRRLERWGVDVHETKAGESRRVPMNSTVQSVLAKLMAGQDSTDEVFAHDLRYLRRAFTKAVKKTNLIPFRFHDLRHTFASRLAMHGTNDRTIMALGEWKSPAMLARYAHLSSIHLWQAVEGLTQITTVTETGSDGGAAVKAEVVENYGAGNGI